MKLYKQIFMPEAPTEAGWYNTDKGLLFWFNDTKIWSCRDDKVSDEYPKIWYQATEGNHCDECGGELPGGTVFCRPDCVNHFYGA
jgi:hypothetical protein